MSQSDPNNNNNNSHNHLPEPEPTPEQKAEHERVFGLPWPCFSLEHHMLQLSTLLAAASVQQGLRAARDCWALCLARDTDEGTKAAIEETILRDFRPLTGQGLYTARQCFGNLCKAWAIPRADAIDTLRDISRTEAIARTEA